MIGVQVDAPCKAPGPTMLPVFPTPANPHTPACWPAGGEVSIKFKITAFKTGAACGYGTKRGIALLSFYKDTDNFVYLAIERDNASGPPVIRLRLVDGGVESGSRWDVSSALDKCFPAEGDVANATWCKLTMSMYPKLNSDGTVRSYSGSPKLAFQATLSDGTTTESAPATDCSDPLDVDWTPANGKPSKCIGYFASALPWTIDPNGRSTGFSTWGVQAFVDDFLSTSTASMAQPTTGAKCPWIGPELPP
jgi:hypothetical protein